jgi:hypothetical protein
MPYKIVKVPGGWKVRSPSGVRSKKPHKTRKAALKQQRALYYFAGDKLSKQTRRRRRHG